MEFANICYRKKLEKPEDIDADERFGRELSVTMEHNAFVVMLYMGGGEPNRIIKAFTHRFKDRAIEEAVDIGKLPMDDILKLPHIEVV